ncbi:MAG: protein translocase subunit SecD [Kiritimatiellae bacterium]|nr:protein translocase subunit SecD [Kiritimatiellia bacterium]
MNTDNTSRNDIWKWLALLIIAVFSIYITFPVQEKLRYGLDLKGGTSFTLGVDKDKLRETIIAANPALSNDTETVEKKMNETLQGCDARTIQVVRRRVDGMGMNEPVIQGMKDHRLLVQLPGIDEETRAKTKKSLQSAAFLEFRLTHPRNDELINKLMTTEANPEGYERGGEGFVRTKDYEKLAAQPGYAARLASFHVPDPRYQFMLEKAKDGLSYRGAFVSRSAPARDAKGNPMPITGEYLTSASVERDPNTGSLAISFSFNSKGAKLFSDVTRNYVAHGPKNPSDRGRQLAIILDDTLVSAPVIQSEIGAHGQITGSFTAAEAQQLANDLNAGALPAPLKLLAESSVSPTVGEDAKHAGVIAAGLGFGLVALFMFFYYWYAGLVADIALFLDVALLPAALVFVANVLGVFAKDASMGATGSLQLPVLTMPGIAGLVLTLGMAVDANVIIFERIREEFARKASTGTAIKQGYGRAFTAILDSNITTIVTGVILFIVGTGPVRGFAITLTGGVIISMFTAVVVTRLVFDNTTKPESMKPFKMLNIFKKTPNVDFVKIGKPLCLAAFAVCFLSVAIFGIRAMTKPESVLAVDLTGGTSLVYSVDEKAKPADGEVRKAMSDFDNAAVVQYMGDQLLVKTGETAETAKGKELAKGDVGAYVTKLLQEKFPTAGIKSVSVDEIGSMVGADLKKSGTWAVILSLCAILIYVGFRFEFGFGLGALVALAHDVMISLGLFSLCGRQVSLLVVTALLTIVGYSVNDTIVVFDRIREDLRRDQKSDFKTLCNRALNECLSRTVITSVTTFFAVVALFAFGDGSIFDFALTMLFGVVAGTFSSVCIATPIMMAFYKGKRPTFEKEEGSSEEQ